jgi:hypothetical protein
LLAASLIVFAGFFLGFNLSYWRSVKERQPLVQQGGGDDGGNSANAAKQLGHLRGERVTWIDEHSQPFVSQNVAA